MTAEKGDLLFVYGTLQTVAQHPLGDFLRKKAKLIGTGSIPARLYIIDDPEEAPGANFFPGALPSPDQSERVFGEIYELIDPEQLMPELDRFEACGPEWPEPQEFLLRKIDVKVDGGQATRAWCYLYTWDVSGAERVISGRFTEISSHVR